MLNHLIDLVAILSQTSHRSYIKGEAVWGYGSDSRNPFSDKSSFLPLGDLADRTWACYVAILSQTSHRSYGELGFRGKNLSRFVAILSQTSHRSYPDSNRQ